MSVLKPEILSRNGKKLFAVIPYEAFVELQERLEDADDLLALEEAKCDEGDAPTISSDEMRRILNIPRAKAVSKRSKSKQRKGVELANS